MADSTALRPLRSPTNRLVHVLRQHPLVGFYVLAFSLAWGMELLVLGLWHLPQDGLWDALRIILPTLIGGPTLPAFLMTALTEGRAGMDHLLCRYVLWRVGWQWYLFVLLGFPHSFFWGCSFSLEQLRGFVSRFRSWC